MVVSLQNLYDQMRSDSHRAREAAVDALALVAHWDYERATEALRFCLKDPVRDVRLAVVETLERVAQQGHEDVISALQECHLDRSREVRLAALDAIQKIAQWELPSSVHALRSFFFAGDKDTRQAAAELLADVSPCAASALAHDISQILLKDVAASVRRAAAESITALCQLHGCVFSGND